MITKLRLRNFQKHTKLEIELDPLVTCLVGPTDSGKSAVMRALRFLMLNKSGINSDDFISWGKDVLKVSLIVDGHTIQRIRGKGENLYKLDGGTYKSFGNSIPAAIQSILNCGPNNFQRQLDGQFWLTESAGQIAKNLNQIVNLEIIDSATANVNSKLRRIQTECEMIEERRNDAEREMNETKWTVAAVKSIDAIKRLDRERSEIAQNGSRIAKVIADVRNLTRHSINATAVAKTGVELASLIASAERTARRIGRASQIVNQIQETKTFLNISIPDIKPLSEFRKKADALSERRRMAEYYFTEIASLEAKACLENKKLQEKKKQLGQLERTSRRCPTCGRSLPSSVRTSTSLSRPRCSDPTKKIGCRSKPGT